VVQCARQADLVTEQAEQEARNQKAIADMVGGIKVPEKSVSPANLISNHLRLRTLSVVPLRRHTRPLPSATICSHKYQHRAVVPGHPESRRHHCHPRYPTLPSPLDPGSLDFWALTLTLTLTLDLDLRP
jgi:hypothetical protein